MPSKRGDSYKKTTKRKNSSRRKSSSRKTTRKSRRKSSSRKTTRKSRRKSSSRKTTRKSRRKSSSRKTTRKSRRKSSSPPTSVSDKWDGKSNAINKFFDKVFIINLHDKVERFGKVVKQFRKSGVKYERFDAVDGRCKDDECKKKKTLFEKKYSVKIMKKINIPAASLVLGTIQLLRDQVKNKWAHMLICEDDIEFTKTTVSIFEKGIEDLPKGWDVLYLGCGNSCGSRGISAKKTSSTKHLTSLSIVSDDYDWYTSHKNDLRVPCEGCTTVKKSKYLSYPSAPGGTWAYSYSLKGAKKMLKFIDGKVDDHIDQIVIKAVKNDSITAVSFDPPIIMHESGAFRPDSDIPWEW